ncbi:unnamed protein product, partial [Ectocarpus fasciculatus]
RGDDIPIGDWGETARPPPPPPPFTYFLSRTEAIMSGTVWATEPHADLPIKMGTTGAAAKEPSTVFKVFQKAVENHGENPALKFKDATNGMPADDAPWLTLT